MWLVETEGVRADLTTCNRLAHGLLYLWESFKIWAFESFDILKYVKTLDQRGAYELLSHVLEKN
jgi:hypothetical protein